LSIQDQEKGLCDYFDDAVYKEEDRSDEENHRFGKYRRYFRRARMLRYPANKNDFMKLTYL